MPHAGRVLRGLAMAATLAIGGLAEGSVSPAMAQQRASPAPAAPPEARAPTDAKPYDDKLVRLSELLGAVHYLRELCGQNDGQQWRKRMSEILEADGGSALRRAMLSRSFNSGYRSFGRTYQSCTPTAQTAIGKFLAEGAELADAMVKNVQ